MAETQKNGVLVFLIIKGSILNIFKNGKKLHTLSFIPFLYMSYNSLAQKVLPHHNSVRFCSFAQKGVFNFQN